MTNGEMTGRLDSSHIDVSKIREQNETVIAFMEEKQPRSDILDFDGHMHQIVKKLERLEKEWLFGDFDNDEVYMDGDGIKHVPLMETLKAFKSPCHAAFDIIMVILIMGAISIGLQILKYKGYIDTYHITDIQTA